MARRKRRTFNAKFKADAVRLVTSGARTTSRGSTCDRRTKGRCPVPCKKRRRCDRAATVAAQPQEAVLGEAAAEVVLECAADVVRERRV